MAQHGLDPLLAVTAAPRLADSLTPADRERFSSTLQSAVDERPARAAADNQAADAPPRKATSDNQHDERRDDASNSTDRQESAAPSTEPAESNSPEQGEESEAATLTLTTTMVHAEQSPPLSATTIAATPTEEGAPSAVVETATPEAPTEAIPETLDAQAEAETHPAGQSSAQATGDNLSAASPDDATAADALLPDSTVASTTSNATDPQATADLHTQVVAAAGDDDSATSVVAADGESSELPGPSPSAAPTSVAELGEQPAASSSDHDADADDGQSRPVHALAAEESADESATLVDPAEGSPETDTDPAPINRDDSGMKPEAERSSANQDVAASRPWSRIGASRGVHPAAEAEPSDPSAAIDRPRFLQRISGAIEAAERRGGPIQVRLSPPELGSLRIELVMKHGTLAATLETETASARHVLLDNLPALRTRLAEQDIRVEQFDVDVRRDGRETADQGTSERRPGEQFPDRRPPRPSPVLSTTENELADPGESTRGDGENLDVRI